MGVQRAGARPQHPARLQARARCMHQRQHAPACASSFPRHTSRCCCLVLPCVCSKWGLWGGLLNAAFTSYISRGREPWTLKHRCARARAARARMRAA